MDRRNFITSAGALSLAAAAGEIVRAADHTFDPTEQSIAALQSAMNSGATSAEALVAAYVDRITRHDHHGAEHHSVLSVNPNALVDARALD
jgi:amidase